MPYCSRDFCSITESRYARYRSIEEDGGRAAQPAARTAATASQQIEHLKLVIDKYKRMIFGTKSEKLKGELEQLEFQLEELETEQAARQAQEPHSPRATNKSRPRAPRKPLPEDLPREVITHPPATTCCPDCGGALRQFGQDVSEQLERIPASFKVIEHAAEVCLRSLRTGGPGACSGAADRSGLARP
jgi:Transposase C of IS166 homeodomain/zinc-finger binding domain of transposase IS66